MALNKFLIRNECIEKMKSFFEKMKKKKKTLQKMKENEQYLKTWKTMKSW